MAANSDDVEQLVMRFMDGSLTPPERQSLYERCRHDSAAAQDFSDALEMAALLELATHSDTAFVNSVLQQHAREQTTAPVQVTTKPIARLTPKKRRWIMIAGAAAAVITAAVLALRFFESPALARLQNVSGIVEVTRNGKTTAVQMNSALFSGDSIATGSGAAALLFSDGSKVQAGGGAVLKLALKQRSKQIVLTSGTIDAAISPQQPGSPLTIATPHASITVIGTQFSVAVDTQETKVAVEHGKVRVESLQNHTMLNVAQGEAALASRSGLALAVPAKFGRSASGLPMDVAYETKDRIEISSTEIVTSASLSIPAIAPRTTGVLCLVFNAFLEQPEPAGWNHYLVVQVNGTTLGKTLPGGSPRLRRRGPACETTEGTIDWWEQKEEGYPALLTFFGSGSGAMDKRILKPAQEGYRYVLDLSDLQLPPGKAITLTFKNLFYNRYVDLPKGTALKLVINDLEIGYVSPEALNVP